MTAGPAPRTHPCSSPDDRLGIKPLYIWFDGDRLLFASEVRALLASGQIPAADCGGRVVHLPGVRQRAGAAHAGGWHPVSAAGLMVEADQGRRTVGDRAGYLLAAAGRRPGRRVPEQVRAWLADAVGCHLVSDVPLGAFLSGGQDSGATVALGTQALGRPMNTFTLAFDNWPADEHDTAALTAARWGANHQCRLISPEAMLADLPQALAAMDQPTVDGVNSWYVSREARAAGLTVALSGVGGDELFAGYPSFRLAPRLKRLPHDWRWLAHLPGWQAGWPLLPGGPDMRRKLSAYIAGDLPVDHPYFAVRGLLTQSQIASILQPGVNEALRGNNGGLQTWRQSVAAQTAQAARYDAVGEVSWLELSQYMRSTLLRDTDMMSMAHSLEVRVPFVDHILADHILPVSGTSQAGRERPQAVDGRRNARPPAGQGPRWGQTDVYLPLPVVAARRTRRYAPRTAFQSA